MTIVPHDLPSGAITDPTSYQGQLYLELCQMECTQTGGVPNTIIYDDGVDNSNPQLAHNPTIGVGFNLRAQLLPVMQAYFEDLNSNFDIQFASPTYTQDQQLMANLKTIMGESWDGDVPARTTEVINAINAYYTSIQNSTTIASFSLTTGEIQAAFTRISAVFEGEVTSYFNIPDSDERIALMSLAWNSPTPPLHPKSLLGPDLLAALKTGNRAEVWFQIRYNSNGGSSENDGIAKRRYFESQLFGLYNEAPGTAIPQDEALQTYEMMSELTGGLANRSTVFNYENEYETGHQEVEKANNDYNHVLNITVQTLEQALQPAADTLIQHYLLDSSANPYLINNPFSTGNIDPRDVQVAATRGGSDLFAGNRNGYEFIGGNDPLPSLLIAQGGSDTLDASASTTNNALIGGAGNDTILGGNGSDYIVAGTGNDLITLIGGGNDTVVMGDANNPLDGGHDTVDASQHSGAATYYVGAGTHETIVLDVAVGATAPTINVVSSAGSGSTSVNALNITAKWIAPGEWYDATSGALLIQQPNTPTGQVDPSASTKDIEVLFGLQGSSSPNSSPMADRLELMADRVEPVYNRLGSRYSRLQPMVIRSAPTANRLSSLAELQAVAAGTASAGTASSVVELTLDGFTGSSEDGITLGAEPAGPTLPGSSNLSSLATEGLVGNTTIPGDANYVYTNNASTGPVASIYGADSSSSPDGNEINGEGNATYIYAGNGTNQVLLGDFSYKATAPLVTPISATVQGGSGNQSLIGVGNGTETITGGAVGSDTTADTFIDGGGATALLEGGGQNSFFFGGTGADTLVASSVGSSAPSGFNPMTIEMAGVSFWGDAYSSQLDENGKPYQQTALPKVTGVETSPDDVQINLSLYQSDGTFGTPFGLLGSSYDPGTSGSTTLPGSKLIGGTGNDWLIGNVGNDTIIGGDPTDTVAGVPDEYLIGGAGANLIYGGGGTELIYADMTPEAASNWASLDPTDADTIYAGNGTDYIYGSGGNDLIYGGSGTDTINVGNGNSFVDAGSGLASIYGGSGNDTIIADGAAATIQTGDGNTSVEAHGGQAIITTGAGNDTVEAAGGLAFITEGSGSTTLIAGTSTGSDVIESGSSSTTVQLQGGLTESALIARDVNGDLELSDEDSDTQIWFKGYFSGGSGNVTVQFQDGTTWGASQILAASMTPSTDGGNDTLVGSNGNDSITAGYGDTSIVGVKGSNSLTGGAGNDTIQGGSGTDTIEGGSGTTQVTGGTGAETYMYNLGDGSDTIFENSTTVGTDTLQFGAGINPSDVTYSYDYTSNNLLIGFGALSDATITVVGLVAAQPTTQHQITTFAFADGTKLTQLQVIQQGVAIYGTTGNDSLTGTPEMNYFDGKGGNDTEIGEGGNDTFVFNSGYGDLTINESYTSGQEPLLLLGAGITASALHVTTDGTNLMLTDGVSGDQITLDGMWSTAGDGVAEVQLADGTTLTPSQLIQMELSGGTTGNDTIYGTSGADLIDGKGGNDYVDGEGGSDTFVFDSGYGALTINEGYTGGQQPVLQLGAGITAAALHVTTDGTSLMLTDGVSGDQITLYDMWSSSNSGVAEVELADGTTFTPSQLMQMEMTGTVGGDTIYGTSGADSIDGNGGNDSVIGEGGSDTFVFNVGYGNLTISENYGSSQQPVLQLGEGITASTLQVTSNGNDLILTDGISGDQITLDYMASISDYGVAAAQFADGTTLTATQLLQMASQVTGTTGNDVLYGTPGADLIDGKGGDDTEYGEGGSDTFVFNAGYGSLGIYESYKTNQQPVLQMGTGLTASALHVTSDGNYESNGNNYGNDLILTDGVSGDQIVLKNVLYSGNDGVSLVEFADGTTLTAAQLLQMEMTGTPGNDTLYGTPEADLIDGKGGNDVEYGDGGSDTFVFNAGYGELGIDESYSSGQQPVMQLGAGITAATLHVTSDGTGLVLTDGISGDEIFLWNMATASGNGVGVVQFADGTTLTAAQLLQMASQVTGTTGSDTLYGTSGADLFDGKGGDDVEDGEGGSDTFVFNAGYGDLVINEVYTSGQLPVLQLGAGISASALHVTVNGLTDGISGDQITINGMFSGGNQGVALVELADGTTLTAAQLVQMEIDGGTPGNDTIWGTTGADLIDGKGGDDSVVGNGGDDTFVFDAGYGDLKIDEGYLGGQQPVLQLSTGITASALHVTTDGASLYLTDGISGDQITLEYMFEDSSNYGVTLVELADGTTLTAAQLIHMEIAGGTSGNDTIFGTPGADLIDGKGGDDSVIGFGGSDTFVFNSGYGDLAINESYASGQVPVLQLGAGISASTLRVTTNGTNLVLTDGVSGDKITLNNMWVSNTYDLTGVSTVQLADGTTLTAAQLIQMEMTGTTGSDTIYGTSDADLIDGKGGDDVELGDGGNDTFVFNAGYGDLEINESYSSGQQPVLQLGMGITAAALKVTADGTNLVLTDGVSGDQITLDNEDSSNDDGVALVQFTDGTTLTAAQLIQMASQVTGTTGDDTLYGTSGANFIDGKGGNDVEYGEGGNDTFVFNAGYGDLAINESYTSGQQPVLQLGTGITAAALTVRSDYDGDLVLTDGISGDQITLDGMLSNSSDGVASLELADGTALTAAQLVQMEMTGTLGDDSIYGTSGADLIDGKGGTDVEYGKGGSDTFVFNGGYGFLNIIESYTSGQQPVLQLGTGITASALHVTSTDGYSLVLTDGISGDQILLNGMLSGGGNNVGVALVDFADGTTLTAAQLVQMEMTGTTGNDTIYGISGNVIDGKGGDDVVWGNGSDTYVFNAGYGDLEILGSGVIQQSELSLGAGITASALHVTTDGNSLYLTDGTSGDQITIYGMWDGEGGVGEVQLADGTTLTPAQLVQMEIAGGTSGDDRLYGTSGADFIDGKGGNDVEYGEGGSDTFVFNAGYGDLEINESYTSGQLPVLQLGSGITTSELHITTDGTNLFLTDGVSGDQITLDNEDSSSSTNGVAEVQFADGTTLTAVQLIQMLSPSDEIDGTTGNDTLTGNSGADLIDGKGGNDIEYGNGGSDTFVFNSGYGGLEIDESYTSGQQPVLQLGTGITTADLHVTTDGTNLMLTDGTSGDEITLDNMWSTAGNGVAEVQLADGTNLTASQLIQLEMTGTTGNDTIYGTSGADLIDGKGGNDSVFGNGGSDTFVFNSGYADLAINESYTSGQQPVLQLGAGITASTLVVRASGKNLVLTDGVSGDQITLDNEYSVSGDGVAIVKFSDGTTLTAAQLIQLSHQFIGTTGNDTLTGTSGADYFDGKGGSDSLVGDGGSDTFVFDSGYGHLTINESYKSGQQPILQLGTGITASALIVRKSGNNLVLTDGVSGDQITLYDMWSSSTHGVASAKLADGTTLTRAQLIQMEMTGTTGNDTLYGTSGADLIDGKGGDDSVVGGGGSDTFVFDSGYGHLTINETYTSTQQPLVQFGAGITSSALKVTKSGSNLILTDGVSGDQVTLISMATSSTRGVASVKFADGTVLTRSQLIGMETSAIVKTASKASMTASPLQVDPLIHAIASYTGGGGGIVTPTMPPPRTQDIMLHAAA